MPGYCTVEDLRAEGVTEAQASDERLRLLIDEASAAIDRLTGWFFEPRVLVLRLDAYGTPTTEPPYPPIRLSRLAAGGQELPLDPDELIIVGAPVQPGFHAPRITLVNGVFPRGRGSVVASGVWGYTEPDGTPDGRTPLAIRRACMLLVMRLLQPVVNADPMEEARVRGRILSLRTRDQAVTFARAAQSGEVVTEDVQLDDLLRPYRRPFGIGAA
jgi:hypothetical protein